MSTEPAPIGGDVAEFAGKIARIRAVPTPAERSSTIAEDPDVAAMRRAQRGEAWLRMVPPVYDDPTLAKYRQGDGDRFPPAVPEVAEALQTWADNATENLVLLGPVGTGKTYAAWAALRRVYGSGRSVIGLGAVDLLDALRPSSGDDHAAARLRDVDVLLVDDLGAQRDTEWTDERLYGLVHHRWEQRRPLVLTANVDGPEGLRELLGERPYSRIVEHALVLVLAGHDRRRPHTRTTTP